MSFFDIATESASAPLLPEGEFFRKLALEGSITENVVHFFREGLPSITKKLKDSVNFFSSSPNASSDDGTLRLSWLDAKKEAELQVRYGHYRSVSVAVPEGFTGEFLPYVTDMINLGAALRTAANSLLVDYRVIVSSMVTNKANQISLKDLTANYDKAKATRETIARAMSAYFANDTRSRAKISSVIPTMKDVRQLAEVTKQLELTVTKKALTEIQRSVAEVVQVLDLLERQLQSEDVTDISPKAVKNIASGAYELAKFVDQLVAYNYAAISIITCVKSSLTQIHKFN